MHIAGIASDVRAGEKRRFECFLFVGVMLSCCPLEYGLAIYGRDLMKTGSGSGKWKKYNFVFPFLNKLSIEVCSLHDPMRFLCKTCIV